MWFEFFLCVVVLFLLVYLPPYLVLRGFNIERSLALAFSPLVSLPIYSLEAIVFDKMGISCSTITIVVPLLILSLVLFFTNKPFKRNRSTKTSFVTFGLDVKTPHFVAFLAIGLLSVTAFYIYPLGHADSFICGNDIAHHLNLVQSFIDSGIWSTLNTTTTPGEDGVFYPSLWSLIAALGVSLLHTSAPIATNATNTLVIGIIYPLSMYAFSSRIFRGNNVAIFACALLFMAFFGFPWELFLRKTLLYPNALGFALMPAFLATFLLAADTINRSSALRHKGSCMQTESSEHPAERVGLTELVLILSLAFLGLVAICLAHPNTFFTAAIFLLGFSLHAIWNTVGRSANRRGGVTVRILACIVLVVLFALLWYWLYSIPFMHSVVTCVYNKSASAIKAFLRLCILKSPHIGAQYPLAFLVIIGFFACIRDSRRRWLLIPFMAMAAICIANACLPDCSLKHMISGFWYNHPTRLFSSFSFFCIPIAALGTESLYHFVVRLFKPSSTGDESISCHGAHVRQKDPRQNTLPKSILATSCIGIILLVIVVYVLPLPLPRSANHLTLVTYMKNFNDPSYETSFLTQDERDFLEKASNSVQDSERILNIPHDGSVFAYALFDENVVARDLYGDPDDDVLLLDQHIDSIAQDEQIAQTAHDLDVSYVLRLDNPSGEASTVYSNRYDENTWKGIYAITDDTPGFEVVLSEGDMRLYRIW